MSFDVITAVVTPFKDNYEINYEGLDRILKLQLKSNIDGLVIAGSTGEGNLLSFQEKIELFTWCSHNYSDKIDLYYNIGDCSTDRTIELLKEIDNLNFKGYLVVVPYYIMPPKEAIINHYKSIARETKKEIMIYNVPARTGKGIDADAIKELSKISNINSIKDASKDFKLLRFIKSNTNLRLYLGNDDLLFESGKLEADGIVSVISNIPSFDLKAIRNTRNFYNRKEYKYVLNTFSKQHNPSFIKGLLRLIGLDTEILRKPLVPLTAEEIESVFTIIE